MREGQAMQPTNVTRYSKVAILLHWLIALMIIGMMVAGIWMTGAIQEQATQAAAFEVYQLHKSFGLVILLLSLLRLAWRLTHRAPGLPADMPAWEKRAAHATHWLFYGLMIGLPITGWLMVSASPWGLPTMFFGMFEVPHLGSLAELDHAGKELWESRFKTVHKYVAYGGIGLLLMHVGAALKHHFIVRDDILVRMLPFLRVPAKIEE